MASDQEAQKTVTMQDLQEMWDATDSADQPQEVAPPQPAEDNSLQDQPEEFDQEEEVVKRDPTLPSRDDWKRRHYQATQHILSLIHI